MWGQADPVETFIAEHDLDDKAADALRGESPAIQKAVMECQDLEGVRNKSSTIMGRISKAKWGGLAGSGKRAVSFQAGDIENFIAENGVDEKAATMLMNESPSVQQAVLDAGSLQGSRNASASLIGRIKKIKESGGGGGGKSGSGGFGGAMASMFGMGNISGKVQQFIAVNGLDEKAAKSLREQDPMIQQAVLEGGPLEGANNKSAAVIGRISRAQKSGGGMSMGMGGKGMGGGMASMMDNPMMSMMSMMMGMGGGMGMGMGSGAKKGGGKGSKGGGGGGGGNIMQFIMQNQLDEKVSQALMEAPPVVQQKVMEGGTLLTANNPSAACAGRLRDAKKFHPY